MYGVQSILLMGMDLSPKLEKTHDKCPRNQVSLKVV